MKKYILALLFASSASCWANLTLNYSDIVDLYGLPVKGSPVMPNPTPGSPPMGIHFAHDTADIWIRLRGDKAISISFTRPDAFAPLEVTGLLQALSSNENWVQKDDKTWVLPKAGAHAKWDGAGKLYVATF